MAQICTICGSIQFASQMKSLAAELQNQGWRVLMPDLSEASGPAKNLSQQAKNARKRHLISQHFAKIAQADIVLIANYAKKGIEGYIGANTLMGIAYAHGQAKEICLLFQLGEQGCKEEVAALASQVLDGSVQALASVIKQEKILPELLSLKPFQETLHGGFCGPASLKMVFEYYGLMQTEASLAKFCNHDKKLGTSAHDLSQFARQLGFKVTIQNLAEFDDIHTWLRQKVPVIVNWFSRGRTDYDLSEVPDGHYSVVVGLDDESIYLQDPEIGGLRVISRDDFYSVWFDFSSEYISSWDDMIVRQIIAIEPA